MGTAPAFASVSEAMDMAHAALGYLAAADAASLAAETQAECLRGLERTDAISTAARASFLSVFTAGQGYNGDADYSARAWLMHRTGITRGAAAGHTAWAKRCATHPRVVAALAAGALSESCGRAICRWTDQLPEKFREESDELLLAAAAAGLGLRDLAALFAEMYERARADLPDEDPDRDFGDRGVRLVTTFQGAGVLHGDLTPECAAIVGTVLDALAAPAGADAAEAIACDAAMAPIVTGDVNVAALEDVIRLCVELGQPAAACEVHHTKHKADGGTTSVTDCVLLCWFHHQVVIHRQGWTLVLNPDGTTTAWNTDKTKILHSHGPPARAG